MSTTRPYSFNNIVLFDGNHDPVKCSDTSLVESVRTEAETIMDRDDDSSFTSSLSNESSYRIMMHNFPAGVKVGSDEYYNCWSDPAHDLFSVRGKDYLSSWSREKVSSGPYMFQSRGVELFMCNDECPQNIASNTKILNGHLREVPTFLINFRLPFGVFVLYYEIPERFISFLEARYEEGKASKHIIKKMSSMTPSERAICRFFMGDDNHRNSTLKLIPRIVDGPWIVKRTVPSKPAIVGNKLPVSYYYHPQQRNKHLCFEVDLDITSSSAARAILGVVQSYTKSLTIDLGFVIQGNTADELPEQMMAGTRLHQIDTTKAPSFPS